ACHCHSLGAFGPHCDKDGNCRSMYVMPEALLPQAGIAIRHRQRGFGRLGCPDKILSINSGVKSEKCRAGVGGSKCDHCLPGFWGLHLIAAGAQSCK
ncbi:laminin EGF-like protein, partial [Teladorsagia circumcincta]